MSRLPRADGLTRRSALAKRQHVGHDQPHDDPPPRDALHDEHVGEAVHEVHPRVIGPPRRLDPRRGSFLPPRAAPLPVPLRGVSPPDRLNEHDREETLVRVPEGQLPSHGRLGHDDAVEVKFVVETA
eukprot:CAMPEP_0113530978 /NCGR_PEP_ID=MMETSP0015_2-20120614/3243_1 /TAXON_ID=2838 /ORGANISM="Odontella" /LENGTH=126 /DNA_ID=CAMNT_0000429767 /DNA_START=1171 /DNA_END=1551 /DNA_ORIENTATION=- /assembly_acc=CAM_ASM_000160